MESSQEIVNRYEVHACRGLQGDCPFALWTDPAIVRTLEDLLRGSAWLRRMAPSPHGSVLRPHLRFKMALAACPNACTLPQIRDVGIIARQEPRRIGAGCNGCGGCHKACRENAIVMIEDRARLHLECCVGCGACIRACPQDLIEAEEIRLEVLVGGRMGRHPRWAERLCVTDTQSLPGVLLAFLDGLAEESPPHEGVAAVLERIGLEPFRRHISPVTEDLA
jgi:anaerobic sulfite reductase subunit C